MPRVLIDATALPANRGGVGRYVDELVSRLPELGIDLHVASQPRDTSVYAALLPSERVHSTPTLATSRVARLGWEQSFENHVAKLTKVFAEVAAAKARRGPHAPTLSSTRASRPRGKVIGP